MRLAVPLDEAGAFGELEGERGVALRRLGHQAEPTFDELLLLAVAVAPRPQRPQAGERAHQEITKDAGGPDVHADVVCVELAAALRPCDESLPQKARKNG